MNGPARFSIAALTLLASAACSTTTLSPASQYAETKTIGPSGGQVTVTAADDPTIAGTSISIPAGALSSDVTIKIGATKGQSVVSAALALGPVIDFEPSGTVFAKPATITIPINLPVGLNASQVAVMALEGDGSSHSIKSVTVASNLATFQASAFTFFGCYDDGLDGGSDIDSGVCTPSCAGDAACGASDGCGGSCDANCAVDGGSDGGGCTPSCAGDAACGSSDGCGGTCEANCIDAGCTPSCAGDAGCGSSDGCGGSCDANCPVDAGCPSEQTDTFVVSPPRADILFIVDVTASAPGESLIGNAASTFFSGAAGVDYRVAVTTDNDDSSDMSAEFGQLLPCAGCSVPGSTPTIISPSSIPAGGTTADPATAFSDLVTSIPNNVDSNGEHFFLALYNALKIGPQAGVDFFRPGVFFAAITDSSYNVDDTSSAGVGGHDTSWFIAYYDDLFPNPFMFTWNYANPTQTITGNGFADETQLPANIQQMLGDTNGFALNTNDPNWSNALASVWTSAISAHTYFTLVGVPTSGSSGITVSIDGVKVNEFAGPDNPNWTYQAVLNAIVFNPNTDPPKLGSTITVQYPPTCGGTGASGCDVCTGGNNETCQSSCLAGSDPYCCGATCVDEQTDASNCGSCGNACPLTTPTCVQGVCTATDGG